MRTIGITGGIASGKSLVCRLLAPYPVIDADQVSRQVVQPGSKGLTQVVATFGPEFLLPDGNLDRARMRALISRDEGAQKQLNDLLHPLIRLTIQERLAQLQTPVAFVEATLMIETGSYKNYAAVLLVTAPLNARLRRLIQRDGVSEEDARNMINRQWSDARKRPFATVEVRNDGNREQLCERLRQALSTLGVAPPAPKNEPNAQAG